MSGRTEDQWVEWMAGVAGPCLGDDAAVLEVTASHQVVASDMLVEGRHFTVPPFRPTDVGAKAVLRTLSDMAAMGARPQWVLLSLALPGSWSGQAFRALFRGAVRAAEDHGARLVGGDTSDTSGPLVVDVSAGGVPGGPAAVTRSGARPGDVLVVTGALGGQGMNGWRSPRARIEEGVSLAAKYGARAMIDLSDGLAADLPRMCTASGVGAMIENLPIAPAARRAAAADGRTPLAHALEDGEDYELLAALPPDAWERALENPLLDLVRIGNVTRDPALNLLQDGARMPFPHGGHVRRF